MNKPPFTWSDEDRERLVPGCSVVRVSESIAKPGVFNASLLTVIKVYGDHVFFRCGGLFGESTGFFDEPLERLDPSSITTAEQIENAENGIVEEPIKRRAVH